MNKIIIDNCVEEIERRIGELSSIDRVLNIISLTDDPSAGLYMKRKVETGEKYNVPVVIHNPNSRIELQETVERLSLDDRNRIIIQKPFDENKWGSLKSLHKMIPEHMDVDGFGFTMLDIVETRGFEDMMNNPRFSPTAKGVLMIMNSLNGGEFRGNKVTVLGKGLTSGLPIGLMAAQLGCTVRWLNSGTKSEDMKRLVEFSEYVIGCTGKPNIINKDCCINSSIGGKYINVGMTKIDGKWYGDINFEEIQSQLNTVFCNNLFGSTGKLTTLCLILNTLL